MAPLKRTIGVVGLIPKAPGTQVTPLYSSAGLRWLFNRNQPSSMARYWEEASGGLIDMSETYVYGWYEFVDAAVLAAVQNSSRSSAAQAACNAAQGQGLRVNDFDGLIFFVAGCTVNAGATSVTVEQDVVVPAAIFDETGQHDFMAHEVGHVLGLDHSFRNGYKGQYLNGEYGDATCVMSARSYGGSTSAVTFAIPFSASSGINQNAVMWAEAGPGVSFATLWRFLPGFPAVPSWVNALPANPAPTTVTVNAASSNQPGAKLIAVPHAGSPNWYTVEYRPAQGWDQALAVGTNLRTAPGVVIHRILDIGNASQGASWPRAQRVDYVATLATPSSGDDDWNDGNLGVRLVRYDEQFGYAELIIGAQLPLGTTIQLTATTNEHDVVKTDDGPATIPLAGDACNETTYTAINIDAVVDLVVRAATTGFQQPQFQWTVNGAQLPGFSAFGQSATIGSLAISADVEVPTGWQQQLLQSRIVTIGWRLEGNTLMVSVPAGLGALHLNFTAAASETGGGSASGALRTLSVDAVTRRIDLPDKAKADRKRCLEGIERAMRGRWRTHGPIRIPPRGWPELGRDQLAQALVDLDRLEQTHPFQARQIRLEVAAEMRASATDLAEIGATLRRGADSL